MSYTTYSIYSKIEKKIELVSEEKKHEKELFDNGNN
jgi:hypothetical protein